MGYPKVEKIAFTKMILEKIDETEAPGGASDYWRFAEPWVYDIYTDEGVYRFEAEAGFVHNFRSQSGISVLNGIIFMFLPKVGKYGEQWAAHDIAYNLGEGKGVSRGLSDYFMLKGLKRRGCGYLPRKAAHAAVDLMGEGAYTCSRQAEEGLVRMAIYAPQDLPRRRYYRVY